MKVETIVKERVSKMSEGTIFGYSYFSKLHCSLDSLAKPLSRLTQLQDIQRIEKGIYYKPKKTRFGIVPPNVLKVLEFQLKKDNKIKGYIVGDLLYNKLGLTTQIPNVIEIRIDKRKPTRELLGKKIKYKEAKRKIVEGEIIYLEILEAIENIEKISDANINKSYLNLKEKVGDLKNLKLLTKIALDFRPKTRALLGTMLEELKFDKQADTLKKSLNSITRYNIGIDVIKNKEEWWIK